MKGSLHDEIEPPQGEIETNIPVGVGKGKQGARLGTGGAGGQMRGYGEGN